MLLIIFYFIILLFYYFILIFCYQGNGSISFKEFLKGFPTDQIEENKNSTTNSINSSTIIPVTEDPKKEPLPGTPKTTTENNNNKDIKNNEQITKKLESNTPTRSMSIESISMLKESSPFCPDPAITPRINMLNPLLEPLNYGKPKVKDDFYSIFLYNKFVSQHKGNFYSI